MLARRRSYRRRAPYRRGKASRKAYARRRRRVYRAKTRGRRRALTVPGSRGVSSWNTGRIFARRKFMISLYNYATQLTGTGTTGDTIYLGNIFRANSVYDPDLTGAGSSTTYYTLMSNIYSKYRVHACRITARFLPVNANTGPSTVGIFSYDDTGGFTPSTFEDDGLSIQRNVVYRHLQPMAAGSNAGCRLTMFRKSKHVFSVKDLQDEPTMGASFGANPDRQWYYRLFIANMNSGQPVTYNVSLVFQFYVEYYDPKEFVLY